MAFDDDGSTPRKGKVSAFTLLTSWLFNKRNPQASRHETEFLNTRDGYELAKFAQQHFGGDAESKRAHEAAVAAEQAEINALLEGTNAVPILHQQVPVAVPAAPAAPAPAAAPAAAVAAAPAPQALDEDQVDLAVRYLEKLRERGLSVETLAEALIVIESRDVRQRGVAGGD